MVSKTVLSCFLLIILTEEINAGIFVKSKTHSIDPIGYGGAKDPASLESPTPARPKRDAEKNMLRSPIAIRWTISEDRLNELKDNQGGHLSSASFNISNIPGVQYYIGIFPNTSEDGGYGETWIYLYLQHLGIREIVADFNISIETANTSFSKKSVFAGFDSDGIKCCKTEEFFDSESKFIVDGKMTIKMDGILMVERNDGDNKNAWNGGSYSDSLGLHLWNQGENKDFTITTGDGKEIAVSGFNFDHFLRRHDKIPLKFTKMFSLPDHPFLQKYLNLKTKKEMSTIVIDDFTFDIVEKAIKLCYHQNLVNFTNLEDKMALLHFFDKYNIQALKEDLEYFLVAEVDESNVCYLTNAALISNSRKLEAKCTEFLRECLQNTKPIADFDLLDKDFALKLLKNAFYHVSQ